MNSGQFKPPFNRQQPQTNPGQFQPPPYNYPQQQMIQDQFQPPLNYRPQPPKLLPYQQRLFSWYRARTRKAKIGLVKKTALITGTSSGIGLRTAIHLAQAGFMVIATMRDVTKAAPLRAAAQEAGVTIEVRPLDVQDDASVASCVQGVLADYGHIDLLVNNAGAGYLGTLEQTPFTALQSTMDTNFFGVWRLVQAVFPAMRVVGTGRIITVTSVGGLIGQPFNDAYCAAKFAVEGFMESLNEEISERAARRPLDANNSLMPVIQINSLTASRGEAKRGSEGKRKAK